jgi:AcrR family transcriptional regulator
VDSTIQSADAGLRERKKLATRHALAFAAMQLAVERGLENVRVEDITDAVGVSRRTFTNYFSSKEEAIASLHADRFSSASEALRDRPADEPLADSLAEVFAAQYGPAVLMDRERMEAVRKVMNSSALFGEFLKTQVESEAPLAEAIAERIGADPRHDLYSRVLAAAVTAAVRAATGHWIASNRVDSLPDLIGQAVRQVTASPPDRQPDSRPR